MKKDAVTRRQFLGYSSAMGVLFCLPANPLRAGEADKIVWVSPRGNLEVMDDFNLWVAHERGYFKELNLDVVLQPGPTEAMAVTKLVGQKQADIGFPSPGVLLSSVDAGIPVVLVWEMVMKQVFDFALPEDSPIAKVQDLEGKTIAVASEGWRVIIDPIPGGSRCRSQGRDLPQRRPAVGADGRSRPRGRGTCMARAGRPVEGPGNEAQVPCRDGVLQSSIQRICHPPRRPEGRNPRRRLDALLQGQLSGLRVYTSQPACGRSDHVRPLSGASRTDGAPACDGFHARVGHHVL